MKKLSRIFVLFLLITALPTISYAIAGSIQELSDKMAKVMWTVFSLIVVICMLVAGILFLTSGGDPEKIKTARLAFIWGVVGVAVGIIAYSIIEITGKLL